MIDAGVPTARAATCQTLDDAERAIAELGAPVVVKASGLAAGKGVLVCQTPKEARQAATAMMSDNLFGDAGNTILIEEFMEGEELSMFFVTDGERSVALPAAQDHKRLLDGDRGPNTGGMGAYAPVSIIERRPELVESVRARIISPTLSAMRERGTPFTGLLYAGLMLTSDGPKVVEFNCRFGDPETQAVLPILGDSVTDLMHAIARGARISDATIEPERAAATTVLAASGYPDQPRSGDRIDIPAESDGVLVFHAGTKRDAHGGLVTSGGRVLGVTGVAESFEDAVGKSQAFAGAVRFDGKQYRTDIGWREFSRRAGVT
jgi:phosphoribosylamine--glycine ligase